MNKEKQIKRLIKNNERLSQQLAQMRFKLESKRYAKDSQQTKNSIKNLETLKSNWSTALDAIKEQQKECQKLIDDLHQTRNTMLSVKPNKKFLKGKTKSRI